MKTRSGLLAVLAMALFAASPLAAQGLVPVPAQVGMAGESVYGGSGGWAELVPVLKVFGILVLVLALFNAAGELLAPLVRWVKRLLGRR